MPALRETRHVRVTAQQVFQSAISRTGRATSRRASCATTPRRLLTLDAIPLWSGQTRCAVHLFRRSPAMADLGW